MPNSFYVSLPSNVFSYEKNKISDYTTYLPKPLNLSDDYHVALTELTYTKSWYNVQQNSMFTLHDTRSIILQKPGITPGWYKNVHDLITAINDKIDVLFEQDKYLQPKLVLDEHSQKVEMKFGRTSDGVPMLVYLGNELEEMLGFSSTNSLNMVDENISIVPLIDDRYMKMKSKTPDRLFDMKGGIHSLMVYTDIVSHSIVGNTQANFLRSARIDDHIAFGSDINLIFQKPYYFPVNSSFIDKIKINIKDDSGNPIEFQFGRVSVTLHFRKTWKAII